MNFQTAVMTCLTEKYMTFSGRAARSEYWWFFLAYFVGAIVIGLTGLWILGVTYSLALFLPMAAAGYRRLQDTGRPGWYIFVPMVMSLIGNVIPEPTVDENGIMTNVPSAGLLGFPALYGVVMFVIFLLFVWWLTRPSEPGENAYGPQPLGSVA